VQAVIKLKRLPNKKVERLRYINLFSRMSRVAAKRLSTVDIVRMYPRVAAKRLSTVDIVPMFHLLFFISILHAICPVRTISAFYDLYSTRSLSVIIKGYRSRCLNMCDMYTLKN
jgi:hypothetical protein